MCLGEAGCARNTNALGSQRGPTVSLSFSLSVGRMYGQVFLDNLVYSKIIFYVFQYICGGYHGREATVTAAGVLFPYGCVDVVCVSGNLKEPV